MIKNFRIACGLITFSLAACAGDKTLQGILEAQMKDNGYDGWDIIHVQENETDGFVLHTAWTDQHPDNRSEPGQGGAKRHGYGLQQLRREHVWTDGQRLPVLLCAPP